MLHNFLIDTFNLVLYQPLFNALIILYQYLPGQDFGIAVIILTIIIKVVFYPLGAKGIQSQRALQGLQPKVKEIQERYKNDKARQAKETMELYKRENINPFSGCLPLLIQLPILIALYQVFLRGFEADQVLQYIYNFVPNPGIINYSFLGLIDLSKAFWPLAIITGIFQYFQTKMIMGKIKTPDNKDGKPDFASLMQKQMLYFFPVFTVIILLTFPSALALYWLVTTLFTIGQQYLIFKDK